MKGDAYTIAFAGVLGTVCALLLTGAASFTAPYRASNAQAEEVLNILTALGVPFDQGASAQRLVDVFEQNVQERERGDLTVYAYVPEGDQGQPQAFAVRFSGPGLWGPIEGFLALEPDMRTIRAVTFYHQEETPGLGGEISASWFREQFVGKSVVDATGEPGITIGGAAGPNSVNAITGATMTCDKLEAILDGVLQKLVEETNG
ncbi:MAG: FMN-binding protein [Sedimentisphaerales bacterium]|nr:FMN-binding protein [Sedimentisphaerales bacterium]